MSKRHVITTDIHGCLEEFDELLKTVEFNKATDQLIIGGDLVDRGPDSVGVVRRCRELKATSVMGNHEAKHINYHHDILTKGSSKKHFSYHKLELQKQLNDDDWAYLESFPLYIRLSEKLVLVHAGLERDLAIEEQDSTVLTMMRYAWRDDGSMVSMKPRGDDFIRPATAAFWTELWNGPESVIYGHHPQQDGKVAIDQKGDVICVGLDGGSCFGKSLNALIFYDGFQLESKFPQIISIPAKAAYAKLYNDVVVSEETFSSKKTK